MFRQVILSVADNRLVSETIKRYGFQMGARRFVAGETLDDAVRATRAMNQEGIAARASGIERRRSRRPGPITSSRPASMPRSWTPMSL